MNKEKRDQIRALIADATKDKQVTKEQAEKEFQKLTSKGSQCFEDGQTILFSIQNQLKAQASRKVDLLFKKVGQQDDESIRKADLEKMMNDKENPLKRPLSIMHLIGGSQKEEDKKDQEFLGSQGSNLVMNDFIQYMNQKIDDKTQDESLFANQNVECKNLDQTIHSHIQTRLKCQGELQNLPSSNKFFQDHDFQDGPFYQASAKELLYYDIKCNPAMEDDMIAKQIDNPLNSMIFVEYGNLDDDVHNIYELDEDEDNDDQEEDNQDQAETTPNYIRMKDEVKRIIHLDKTFPKFEMSQEEKCNLLCIGTEKAGKSSLINEIFNLNFEQINNRAAGLFHDSVDVTFAAKDFNIGFNIFDFQGKANIDFALIKHFIMNMPSVMLLFQVSSDDYVTKFNDYLSSLGDDEDDVRAKIQGRILCVGKINFNDDVDDQESVFEEIQSLFQEIQAESFEDYYVQYEVGRSSDDNTKNSLQKKVFDKLYQLGQGKTLQDKYSDLSCKPKFQEDITNLRQNREFYQKMKQKAQNLYKEAGHNWEQANIALQEAQQTNKSAQEEAERSHGTETEIAEAAQQATQQALSQKEQEFQKAEDKFYAIEKMLDTVDKIPPQRQNNYEFWYGSIQGFYWLFEDRLADVSGLNITVKKKDDELRLFHMVTKQNLDQYKDNELKTEVQFPQYMNKLKIQQKNQEIKLQQEKVLKLKQELKSLEDRKARTQEEIEKEVIAEEEEKALSLTQAEKTLRKEKRDQNKIKAEQELEKFEEKIFAQKALNRQNQELLSHIEKEKNDYKNKIIKSDQQAELFKEFLEVFLSGDIDKFNELVKLLSARYMQVVNKLKSQLNKTRSELHYQIQIIQKNGNIQNSTVNEAQKRKKEFEIKMQEIEDKINSSVLGMEQFLREANLVLTSEEKEAIEGLSTEDKFFKQRADNFDRGQTLEIIDGDLGTIDQFSLTKIMEFVQAKRNENTELVVITVLGPQSTGKSTLLNHLFGSKFHVSDGRCTKGLNAMLVKTDLDDVKEFLILDSEGLFSLEKNNKEYDKHMVIFCFSVSNFVLINMKGELNVEVEEILAEAIKASSEIQSLVSRGKSLPQPIFIVRDQANTNSEETLKILEAQSSKINDTLKKLNSDKDVEGFNIEDNERSIKLFYSAVEKKLICSSSHHIMKTNLLFRNDINKVRLQLFQEAASTQKDSRPRSFKHWIQEASAVWSALTEFKGLKLSNELGSALEEIKVKDSMETFRQVMCRSHNEDINPLNKKPCKPFFSDLIPIMEEGLREQDLKTINQEANLKTRQDSLRALQNNVFDTILTKVANKNADQSKMTKEFLSQLSIISDDVKEPLRENIWSSIMNSLKLKARKTLNEKLLAKQIALSLEAVETSSIDMVSNPQGGQYNEDKIDEAKQKFKQINEPWIDQIYQVNDLDKTLKRLANDQHEMQNEHLKKQIDRKFDKLKKTMKDFIERKDKKVDNIKDGVQNFAKLVLRTANSLQMRHDGMQLYNRCNDITEQDILSKKNIMKKILKTYIDANDAETSLQFANNRADFEEETYEDVCSVQKRMIVKERLKKYKLQTKEWFQELLPKINKKQSIQEAMMSIYSSLFKNECSVVDTQSQLSNAVDFKRIYGEDMGQFYNQIDLSKDLLEINQLGHSLSKISTEEFINELKDFEFKKEEENKTKRELIKDLDDITNEIDLDSAWGRIRGCTATCPTCKTNCESTFQCDEAAVEFKHYSKYHGPMLYSQLGNDQADRREIKQDHCMSEKNLSDDTYYPAKDFPANEPFGAIQEAIDRQNVIRREAAKKQSSRRNMAKQAEKDKDIEMKTGQLNFIMRWKKPAQAIFKIICRCQQEKTLCNKCDLVRGFTEERSTSDDIWKYKQIISRTSSKVTDQKLQLKVEFDKVNSLVGDDIEYQIYIQNQLGVIVWPKDKTRFEELKTITIKRSDDPKLHDFEIKKDELAMVNYRIYLETQGWQLRNSDISQAKGDSITSEFRDSWNEQWKAINDIYSGFKQIEKQEKVVERV